jgi:hypothetical protein
MRLSFRSILALAVCFVVILSFSFLFFNWQMHYASFRADLAVGSVFFGVACLSLLAPPDRGLPVAMSRKMFDEHYGREPSPVRSGTAAESRKAHRSFALAIGGHVAHTLGHFQALVAAQGGYQRQVVNVTASS